MHKCKLAHYFGVFCTLFCTNQDPDPVPECHRTEKPGSIAALEDWDCLPIIQNFKHSISLFFVTSRNYKGTCFCERVWEIAIITMPHFKTCTHVCLSLMQMNLTGPQCPSAAFATGTKSLTPVCVCEYFFSLHAITKEVLHTHTHTRAHVGWA